MFHKIKFTNWEPNSFQEGLCSMGYRVAHVCVTGVAAISCQFWHSKAVGFATADKHIDTCLMSVLTPWHCTSLDAGLLATNHVPAGRRILRVAQHEHLAARVLGRFNNWGASGQGHHLPALRLGLLQPSRLPVSAVHGNMVTSRFFTWRDLTHLKVRRNFVFQSAETSLRHVTTSEFSAHE